MTNQQQSYKARFLGSKQGLLFLLFAALIWVLSALSEEYTAVVPVHIEIENDAADVILLDTHLHIDASMSATGFSILYRRLFPPSLALSTNELSVLDLDNPVVSTQYLVNSYRQQFPSRNDLNGFVDNAIALPLTAAVVKSFTPALAAPAAQRARDGLLPASLHQLAGRGQDARDAQDRAAVPAADLRV